jgi:TPR repeat protein
MVLAGPSLGGSPATCRSCGCDLSHRFAPLVFCPECRRRLADPPTLLDRLAHAAHAVLHFHRTALPTTPVGLVASSSAVVRGYGAALYNLGWRYERGAGRNVPEAVRCYRKSARLGNPAAANRLKSAGSAAPVVPIDDPLGEPEVYADGSGMTDDWLDD